MGRCTYGKDIEDDVDKGVVVDKGVIEKEVVTALYKSDKYLCINSNAIARGEGNDNDVITSGRLQKMTETQAPKDDHMTTHYL